MKDNALSHSLFRKIAFNDDQEAFKKLFSIAKMLCHTDKESFIGLFEK
ncbi:MAG: hypothetical protein ACOX19_12295 [Fermentimonas sp.]